MLPPGLPAMGAYPEPYLLTMWAAQGHQLYQGHG